jgi:hypothetical protein
MNNFKKWILITFLFTGSVFASFSQQLNYTLNRDYLWGVDNYFNNKDENFQTFSKPFLYEDINQIKDSSVIIQPFSFKKRTQEEKVKKLNFRLYPILNTGATFEKGAAYPDFAVGGNLQLNIGNKLSFNCKAMAGRGRFSLLTEEFISKNHVIPGIGYAYHSTGDYQFDYQYYSGYLSYSPNKIVNIQAGQDKNFFGDGYRSLFLSDVAAPYPFLKIATRIWHLTYINMYTIMKDVTNPSHLKKDWLTKYGTFHYLGWNITKRIQIGLFESIVWQGSDSARHRGYDVNYLNPVLFFRPVEYSLGSSDNAFAGFSFKIKLFKKQQLYGQILLDEFLLKEIKAQNGWWANKYGFQGGIKSFDLFRIQRLNFQTEVNYVRPYTYSHGSVQQNYGHMNQPLAHPLGANFIESATFLNYRYKRIFIEAKCVYALYGEDSLGTDYGKNIFISYNKRQKEYGNTTTQGIKTNLINLSFRAAYIVDAKMNLRVELGIADRITQVFGKSYQLPMVFIGFRTDLCNLYNDF